MKCLALDTSGLGAAVALAQSGEVVARVDHDLGGGYAESLFGLFDQALEAAGWSKADLEAVAAVEGPGSFTGLRVGIMTAKTLTHARGWQLCVAHASDLLAVQYDGQGTELSTLLPAGRAHAYARAYQRPDGDAGWTALGAAERVDDAELDEWLARRPGSLIVESGYGQRLGGDRVDPAWRARRSLVEVLAVAGSRGAWPVRSVSPGQAEPLYAGPSQAERARGLDLTDEIRRPRPPVSWT